MSEIDNAPLKGHANYAAIDDALRATFVSTVSSLQSALQSGDATVWSATLNAMSKATNSIYMIFDFDEKGWKGITAEKAVCLIDHLPPITKLYIYNANFGVDFVDSVSNYIRTTSTLEYLNLYSTEAGGEDGRQAGVRLAEAVSSNTTLTKLWLSTTDLLVEENVEEWAAALMENKTLTEMCAAGVERWREPVNEAIKSRTPVLTISD